MIDKEFLQNKVSFNIDINFTTQNPEIPKSAPIELSSHVS